MLAGSDFKENLNNKSWRIQAKPFPHAVLENLFDKNYYSKICDGFEQHQRRSEDRSKYSNYDAVIRPISHKDSSLFDPLFRREWLSLVCAAFQRSTTFEIDAATHSHPAGSRSGWIHNDYNPGWFAREAAQNELIFSDSEDCKYKGNYSEAHPYLCRMRYITMIYYLLNDEWVQGSGGETGIYGSAGQSVEKPDIAVPPKNNTLLIFECRPDSFHSFVSSKIRRNSITLWLHRPMAEARKQWPYHEPVYWR